MLINVKMLTIVCILTFISIMLKVIDAYLMTFNSIDTMKAIKNVK